MSVTVRKYRNTDQWEVDIRVTLPDGSERRERTKAKVSSKTAAVRWGQDRERELLTRGVPTLRKEVPTLEEFAPRFLEGYAQANRQKPSGIAAKRSILSVHLVPRFGRRRLDAVSTEDVQRLKSQLVRRAPKTVNNVLTVLNMLLKTAVAWEVVDRMPCTIRLLPVAKKAMGFYDFDEYERLVAAAKELDRVSHLIVLLGGEAGLRCGEMIALEWTDVDLSKRQLCVQRSVWQGHVTVPKGGRLRYVPLTRRLTEVLREHRHLRSARVICRPDGSPVTWNMVRRYVQRAARRAQVSINARSGVHRLRHTFCSRLAMRGAAARAIQDLAGHQDLATTERYMHLSPGAIDAAIRLLDSPGIDPSRGEIVEKQA
jgi:integrase